MPTEIPITPDSAATSDAAGRDPVDEASRESFPASDAPAWPDEPRARGSSVPPGEPGARGVPLPEDQRSQVIRGGLGEQVVLEFDTGTRIAGVALAVRPATGRVEILILGDAVVFDPRGVALEHQDRMVVCLGQLVGYHRQH